MEQQRAQDHPDVVHSHVSHAQDDPSCDYIERASGVNAGISPVQDQPPALVVLATKFVDNIKSRFGEQAHETDVIYRTLGRFKYGEVSKREALSTIRKTLNSHYDIKYDLINILNHQDAQWGPYDFELSLLSVELPVPQFLQPVHEPQMRFPPMSAPWQSSSRVLPAFGTPVTNDTNRTWAFEEPNGQGLPSTHLGSPFISPTFRDTIPVQLNSPAIQHMPHVPLYESAFDRVLQYMKQGDVPLRSQYLPPKRKLEYSTPGDEEGISRDLHHRQFLEGVPVRLPAESLETRQVEIPRRHRRSESVTTISPNQLKAAFSPSLTSGPYMLGDPFVTPIGQSAIDMPPPPRKRSRKSSSAQPVIEQQHVEHGPCEGSEDVQDQQAFNSASSRKTSEGSGNFIHGLCGKRFGTRSKVKKHHWGNKLDDMATTTGCWHKRGRPDINWDSHSSCQEVRKPPSLQPSRAKSISAENKAPMVPTMGPGYHNILLGIPPVQEPYLAARSPETPSTNMEGGYPPYNTHGFPSSSPFQNLLTAVNVAAKIESLIPKGRSDSMIFFHLDDQAIAAEHTEQSEPPWVFTTLDQVSYLDPMSD